MYIVRDKKKKIIIHINPAPIEQQLHQKDVYFNFNEETMEIGKTGLSMVPEKFDIDEAGNIVSIVDDTQSENAEETNTAPGEINLIEEVKKGTFKLNEPFEYVEGNEIKKRTVEEAVAGHFLVSIDQCHVAGQRLNDEVDSKILQSYRYGMEMKLTKDYLGWVRDGQPENDLRELEYNKMQLTIENIKNHYRGLKEKIKDRQAEIEKKIKSGIR